MADKKLITVRNGGITAHVTQSELPRYKASGYKPVEEGSSSSNTNPPPPDESKGFEMVAAAKTYADLDAIGNAFPQASKALKDAAYAKAEEFKAAEKAVAEKVAAEQAAANQAAINTTNEVKNGKP